MIPIEYLIIIIGWVLLLLGFKLKDTWILAFSSLLLMSVGIYVIVYALPELSRTNLTSLAFAFIHIGVGAYVFIRATLEVAMNNL